MKNIIIPKKGELNTEIIDPIDENKKHYFRYVFDHSWLKKSNFLYYKDENRLNFELRRHGPESKARKRIIGLRVWDNRFTPDIRCNVEIDNVLDCVIRDEDPANPKREEVLIGGVIIDNSEIYLGSYSFHENPFDVTIKIGSLKIRIRDLDE